MPELPEVEIIRRGLERHVLGRRIARFTVREPRLRTRLAPRSLGRVLVGRSIEALDRRAKYLLLHLSGGQVLVVHLGMTGQLVVERAGAPLRPHTHVRIGLEADVELRFVDARRFGQMFVVTSAELHTHPRLARLGPEPLGPGFTPEHLRARAWRARRTVKSFLMDAGVVAGLGNIYAAEALHRAGVHPGTRAGRLSLGRWKRVHAAVREVLDEALLAGGTTLQDYRDADGQRGRFQMRLRVYGHEGDKCARCHHRIRRSVQSGRSTFYCPGCQH